MTNHDIRLINDLDAEFTRVAQQHARRKRRRARSVLQRTRWRTPALVSVLTLLLAGGATAAVTGVFTPHREPDGLLRLTEPQAIASGTFEDNRSWRLFGSESDAGFCLELELPAPSIAEGPVTYGGCGGGLGTLHPASLAGGSSKKNAIVYGTAPEDARTVTVITEKGNRYTATAIDDPYGFAGKFFVTDLPTTTLGTLTLRAHDDGGKPVAIKRHTHARDRTAERLSAAGQ